MAGLEGVALTQAPAAGCGRDWMWLDRTEGSSSRPEATSGGAPGEAPPRTGNSAVELIAGPFAAEVDRIWPGRRLGEYFSAPDARRHLWHACLAAASGLFRPTDPDAAEVAYARFTTWKGKYLVAQAYGEQPPGLLGALGRLGPTARRPEVYRALVEVMAAEGAGSRFLSRSSALSDDLVLAAAALPKRLRSKRVLKELAGKNSAPEEAAFFAWAMARLEALNGPGTAAAMLAAAEPMKAMEKVGEALPFPAPPWPGRGLLTPVTSPDRLTQIAKAFENCLSHYTATAIIEVRIGLKCFYEWRGDEPALLEFRSWPPLGWRMAEAKGARNAALSERTRAGILSALAQCPAFAPIWPTDERELLAGL